MGPSPSASAGQTSRQKTSATAARRASLDKPGTVPFMVEKVRQSAHWTTAASVAESIKEMQSIATFKGARIEEIGDSSFTAHFGSKMTYRLWGVFLKRGSKAVPFKVSVVATALAVGGVDITATGESDEGGFIIYRIELATRLLNERISDVLNALQPGSERYA